MKHIPQRTCVCCRSKFDKEQLLRVVKFNNEFSLDKSGNKDGRGAYICGASACLIKLKKQRALDRVFKGKLPESVYDEIINHFNNVQGG